MLKARTPRVAEYFFEYPNEAGSDHTLEIIFNVLKQVKSYRESPIGRIEYDYIIDPLLWNTREHFIREFSVRINHNYSPAFEEIINRHIFKQYRFSNTRLTDYIDVPSPVVKLNSKKLICISKCRLS